MKSTEERRLRADDNMVQSAHRVAKYWFLSPFQNFATFILGYIQSIDISEIRDLRHLLDTVDPSSAISTIIQVERGVTGVSGEHCLAQSWSPKIPE